MVSPIEYLRWHESHSGGTHDLATSDQRAVAGEWGVEPDVLADLPDPPADVTLREQLAAVYGVAPEQVVVTTGATQANLAVFAAAVSDPLDPEAGEGDDPEEPSRVLVEMPGYEPLRATPAWLGAEIDRFRRPAADGYPLSVDRIAAAATEATDLVVTTNRHNPSGTRVGRETLAAAATAAREHDARLLVDEVYAPFGDEATDGPFGGPSAAGIEGTVVTGSLTKFLGLGGLQIGWAIADEAFVDRLRVAMGYLTGPATPSVALARRALANRETVERRAREVARENHRLLADFVAGRDDLDGTVYDGTTYAFLKHAPEDGDPADGDAVSEAAAAHDCTVVPGRFFDAPDRFRVSLGGTPDAMAASLSALGAALDDL